jgi:hypothetical protein
MIPATKDQKAAIRRNCEYNVDIKEERVQWATGDVSKISLNDLSFEQAEKVIAQQTGNPVARAENWAKFDSKNPKHKMILSLCRQAQWTVPNDRHGEVADLARLSSWLKEKSPIKKPLLKMDDIELEKVIKALKGVIKWKFK